ncbi:uncharacterized protein LOC104663006 [Rhinopithecus roxellana]|uniref:uncharacterized protein LOC104663006 n=1 Tax=Rhinopithecus roxellana TaxID=61622 RepID=UPI00123738DF|nr:uncharacterized protein LOC104663006 [Rhinopithecus roxellana]
MAAGAQRPAGPAPCAHEPQRKLLQPRPGPPAGPPPALPPPPARPARNNFGARPLPPPAPAPAARNRPRPQPPPSPRPALGAPGPALRALNPVAAGHALAAGAEASGGGERGPASPHPAPAPRPAAFSGPGAQPLTAEKAGRGGGGRPGLPGQEVARVSHSSLRSFLRGKGRPGRQRAPRGWPGSRMLSGLRAVALGAECSAGAAEAGKLRTGLFPGHSALHGRSVNGDYSSIYRELAVG